MKSIIWLLVAITFSVEAKNLIRSAQDYAENLDLDQIEKQIGEEIESAKEEIERAGVPGKVESAFKNISRAEVVEAAQDLEHKIEQIEQKIVSVAEEDFNKARDLLLGHREPSTTESRVVDNHNVTCISLFCSD